MKIQPFLFFTLFASCSEIEDDHATKVNLNQTSEITVERIDSSIHGTYFFNVEKFKLQADSFVSRITGSNMKFISICSDTLKKSILFETENGEFRSFHFDPPKGNKIYRFSIFLAEYPDKEYSKHAFERLRASESTAMPGLTYTNDFVIISARKLIWLNTGCSYSYANHLRLKNILLDNLHYNSIEDSIKCVCGGGCK